MPLNGKLTPDAILCEREREILTWLARGKTADGIAIIVGLSHKTIEWYIARAKLKLKCVSIPQAIVAGLRTGQISPGFPPPASAWSVMRASWRSGCCNGPTTSERSAASVRKRLGALRPRIDGIGLEARQRAGCVLLDLDGRFALPCAEANFLEAVVQCQRQAVALGQCFGEWEGKSAAEIEQDAPGTLDRFKTDPVHARPAGAEPLADFHARVAAALDDLLERHAGEHVLLVGHAGVMRMALAWALQIPLAQAYRIEVATASLTRLRFDGSRASLIFHGSPRVER